MLAMLMLVTALSTVMPAENVGTDVAEHVTMRVSPDTVSVVRLPDGQKITEVIVQDPSRIDMNVADDTTIAVRGATDADGTHLLVRRANGRPLDVALLPAAAGMRSQVVRIDGARAAPIPEWHVDGADISVLKPGFAVRQALATPGVRVEALPSDGAFVATGGTVKRGDVMVIGQAGEIGIYRLD